jgi:T5orf172 domain
MTEPGWVYAMSNESMPGLIKIGFTSRSPSERLEEANAPSTFGPPTPYRIEFAKRVLNANQREKMIHRILSRDRVNMSREFFRVSLEVVRDVFALMDGEEWGLEETEAEFDVHIPTGRETVDAFLNEHIFPPEDETPGDTVTMKKLSAVFARWKAEKGYPHGAIADVRQKIIDAYGSPKQGPTGGWTNFELRC